MMQTTKNPVKLTIPAFDVDMGGLAVKQALPTQRVEQIDPFLLLHHTKVPVEAGTAPMGAGVPPHPHRGFSAVTIVIDGEVHHRDSLGNSSIIGAGGVQWVNAGRGIVHSERPSAALAAKGGAMDVIQLWVNSPASAKMEAAGYKALNASEMPVVNLAEHVEMHLISGKYQHTSGSIKSPGNVRIGRIYGKAGSSFELELFEGEQTAIFIISGKGNIAGHGIAEEEHLYAFESSVNHILMDVREDMDVLYMAGAPLNEPLVSYGPFVMNSQTEIMQAMRDYQVGKMGVLIEE